MTNVAQASPQSVLKDIFGFDSFRGHQAEVIDHVIRGNDALVLMPTGGGKSLCYQIPALCRSGVAVIISPLIALMQDQVAALCQLGIRAGALNSAIERDQAREIERKMRTGEIDLVYVAPERLLSDGFINLLHHCKIALFAIDEAHCVSQWGHDFRPEYLQMATLAETFSHVPRLALTATADGPTQKDIIERLHLQNGRVFATGFDRPNIRYKVAPKNNARQQLLNFLNSEYNGAEGGHSGIVYCMSRNKVEETADWLREKGFNALAYHAGLDPAIRANNQAKFIREDGIVMVATIAFGMGIDKPDVRFVVHMDLPKSLEAYYQETGRAGRDGLASQALMLYGIQDVGKLHQFIESSNAPERQRQVERQKLNALLGYCESATCRRQVLLDYFGETLAEPCGNCDACLEPIETFDGTTAARKFLSCVYRTGESFGAGHVIDVLLGEENERIKRFAHDRLSTYGIGKELKRETWRSIARQLSAMGHLRVDSEGFGALKLTETCRPVLRGETTVLLRKDPSGSTKRSKGGNRGAPIVLRREEDKTLFEALRARRKEIASEQGVPPYVIFMDATFLDMVDKRPQTLSQFAELNGVGKSKLERYGEEFLEIIARHP